MLSQARAILVNLSDSSVLQRMVSLTDGYGDLHGYQKSPTEVLSILIASHTVALVPQNDGTTSERNPSTKVVKHVMHSPLLQPRLSHSRGLEREKSQPSDIREGKRIDCPDPNIHCSFVLFA